MSELEDIVDRSMVPNEYEVGLDMPDVAAHYDSLDAVYRAVWGEALHHGYWVEREESLAEALVNHRERVMRMMEEFGVPERVVDVGCGYGVLCAGMWERWKCEVVGVTNSHRQFSRAGDGVVPGDWRAVDVGLEFSGVTMVEVTGHVDDLDEWFAISAQRMRSGGVLVLTDFFAADSAKPCRLRKLARDGSLAALRGIDEVIAAAEGAGFELQRCEDWTHEVKRTWPVIAMRMFTHAWRSAGVWKALLRMRSVGDLRLAAIPRMIRAYKEGDLVYAALVLRKAEKVK